MFTSFIGSLLMLFLLTFTFQTQRNAPAKLRQRVTQFYSFVSTNQLDQMWTMLSSGLKKKNDYDKKKYVSTTPLTMHSSNKLEVQINKIAIHGKQATVRLKLTLRADGKEIGFEEHEETWVLERKSWFFDSSRTTKYKFFDEKDLEEP